MVIGELLTVINERNGLVEIVRQRHLVVAPITNTVHPVLLGIELVDPSVPAHLPVSPTNETTRDTERMSRNELELTATRPADGLATDIAPPSQL